MKIKIYFSMIRLSLVFFFGFILINESKASFVNNYSDWNSLSKSQKQAYISGIFDGEMIQIGNDANMTAYVSGLNKCGVELNLTSDLMASEITKYYQKNPDYWGYSVNIIFHKAIIANVCKDFILGERKRFGLE